MFWISMLLFDLSEKIIHRYPAYDGAYNALSLLTASFLIFAWYRTDAYERKYQPPKGLGAFVIVLGLVAVPIYVARSRGFVGLAKFIGMFFVCLAGYSGILFACEKLLT
jgi:hypothetical protein